MNDKKKIDIIGGGPAGLSVGYYAKKMGMNVTIYESTSLIGGNCKTIIDGEFRYDTGAHRLHDKDSMVTNEIKSLLGDSLLKVSSPSKIYFEGRFFNFPINIKDIFFKFDIKTLSKILIQNIWIRLKKSKSPQHFKDVAYYSYGKTISDMFLVPYTEKLWGQKADALDISITGGRLKSLDLKSIITDMFKRKNNNSGHYEGDFYYPVSGFGEIFDAMGSSIGANNIHLNSQISYIEHKDKNITSIIDSNGACLSIENLVYTASLDHLLKSLNPKPPRKIMDHLDNIKYRSIFICAIYLDIKNFSPNASIYFPDSGCPFTRIYEPKNRSKKMSPKNKTCLVIEVPIGENGLGDSLSKKMIYEKILNYLIDKKLLDPEKIINYKSVKVNNAYPVISTDSVIHIEKIKEYLLTIKNLYLVGRNSDFEYIHTHDIMRRSRLLVNKMVSL